MSWPCIARCKEHEFCDVITNTCIGCQYICDPKYKTPEECKRQCPEWTSPTEKAVTENVDTHLKNQQIYANLPIIVIVLCLLVCTIIILVVFLVRNHKKECGKRTDDEKGQRKHLQPPECQQDRLAWHCCSCCNKILKQMLPLHCVCNGHYDYMYGNPKIHTTRNEFDTYDETKQAGYSTKSKRDNKIEIDDRLLYPETYSDNQKKDSTATYDAVDGPHSNASKKNNSTSRTTTPSTKRVSRSDDSRRIPAYGIRQAQNPQAKRGKLAIDGPAGVHTPSSGSHYLSFSGVSREFSADDFSLNLQFYSDSAFRENAAMATSISTREQENGGHWKSVMRVYDHIDQRLHEMSWIAGCMISNTALKIVVSSDPSNEEKAKYQQRIRNVVPSDIPTDRFLLTFEGPAIQTTFGSFGSGSMIHVRDRQGHGRSSTTTAMARCVPGLDRLYITKMYAFTSGHNIHNGMSCEIQSNCDSGKNTLQGECVAHVDNLGRSIRRNIKTKIYDFAMIKLAQETSFANSRKFALNGKEVTLRVRISKMPLQAKHLKPGRKVLIFGGPNNRTMEGIVDRSDPACTCLVSGKQVINMIQLASPVRGESIIYPGHSGSLVAWYPSSEIMEADNSIILEAFAVVAGINVDSPRKAYALPLWDQMEQVLKKDPQFAHFEDRLRFEDYVEDSGIYET